MSRISNTVSMNTRLQKRIERERKKLQKLRLRLLNPQIVQKACPNNPKFNVSSDNEDAAKGKRVTRNYVEQLEEALARAHQLLDDKWYDLKQIMYMHQNETKHNLHVASVIDEI